MTRCWIYPEVGRSALHTVDPDSDGAIARARRQEVARRREGHAHDRLRVATKSKRQQQWVNVNCGDFLIQLTKKYPSHLLNLSSIFGLPTEN